MNRARIAWAAVLMVTWTVAVIGPVTGQEGTGGANTDTLLAFWADEAARDYEHLATLVQPDFVRHSAATAAAMPDIQINNRDAYLQFLAGTAASFPDYHVEPLMLASEGELVAFNAHFVATPPDGFWPVQIPMIGFMRFADGLLAEAWVEWDNLTWAARMAPVTELPLVSVDELAGVWQLTGLEHAAALAGDLQIVFQSDGQSKVAYAGSVTSEDLATYEVEDGHIHFLTSIRNPACAEATYTPAVLRQGEMIIGLHFALSGEDCYTERMDLMDGHAYSLVSR